MVNSRKIVIEGIDPHGLFIAKRLADGKEDVILVDKDEKLCDDISRMLLDGIMVVEGEIKKDALNRNGTTEFDVFIAARDNDGENLISCLYIKNHYKKVDIMSVVQDEESEEAFTKEGILTASPERAITKRFLKCMAGHPKYIDIIASLGTTELPFFEIKPGSRLEGKKISTIPLHSKDYNVVSVYREKNKKGDKVMIAKEDFILKAGDVLQLLINPQYHKKLEQYIEE